MNASLYSISPQTATIAASPFQKDLKMPGNVTATKTAIEERLYAIGEVSRLADLKPFVLRYWGTEFPPLQPIKTQGGPPIYRQDGVDMAFPPSQPSHDEGFTLY